jgi:hypothetical protein
MKIPFWRRAIEPSNWWNLKSGLNLPLLPQNFAELAVQVVVLWA